MSVYSRRYRALEIKIDRGGAAPPHCHRVRAARGGGMPLHEEWRQTVPRAAEEATRVRSVLGRWSAFRLCVERGKKC